MAVQAAAYTSKLCTCRPFMPIYAYRCATCGHVQDVLQKMSDALLTTCPACGAATYEKQVTAAGFQLKGSGWYVTDFRGGNTARKEGEKADGEKVEAKADAAPPDKGDAKSDAKSDAKPDAAKTADGAATAKPAPSPAPAAAAASAPVASPPSAGA